MPDELKDYIKIYEKYKHILTIISEMGQLTGLKI